MDRIFESGAAVGAPSVPSSPSAGYPTAGNPSTGTPATKPGAYWFHMIVEELMTVISAAGITPAAGTLTQLKQALDALYGGGYLLIKDEKSSGTSGGASSVGVQTRTLNTVSANTVSGASLSSNQITLPAGTYRVSASTPALGVNNTQAILYNVTDAAVTIRGTSENGTSSAAGDPVQVRSFIHHRMTLASTKVFEIRQYCNEVATNGLGGAVTQGTETYTVVEIIKE